MRHNSIHNPGKEGVPQPRAVAGHTRRTDLDFEGPRHPAPISIILASLPHTQSGVYSSGELARMFREP